MVIRVAIVEDHPLMRKIVREELENDAEIQVVGETGLGSKAQQLVREQRPHVLVFDLGMSKEVFEPITAIKDLRANFPALKILVLTGYNDPLMIRSAVDAGAHGYLLKSDDLSLNLPKAVKAVNDGQHFYSEEVAAQMGPVREPDLLNSQELAILRLLADGLTNTKIAEALSLSEKRIRNILTIVYAKLEIKVDPKINSRVAGVRKAREMGLLDP